MPLATGANWTIACGQWRGFLIVCNLNDSRVFQDAFMCNIATRAWWRISNMEALCWATSLDGSTIYYADNSTNHQIGLPGALHPSTIPIRATSAAKAAWLRPGVEAAV